MVFSLTSVPSTTSVLSAYTTFAASAMLVRTVLNEVQNMSSQIIPKCLQDKILSKLGGLIGNLSPQMTLVIDEYNGLTLNQVYESSEAYLRTKIPPSISLLKVSKAPQQTNFSLTVNKGEKIVDAFKGIELTWEMICIETQKTSFDCEGLFSSENVEHRSFELRFDRKYKEMVLTCYLPYVMERGKIIKEESKVLNLYSLGSFHHANTNLDHPSTFDTLALDPILKKEVIDDLDRFVKRRDYYRRVGKAWKRGYLLYGPPGTGKSSLIAAMANYLKFNIYDLELTAIRNNSNLRQLLVSTANRSIIVIEDIDCSTELQNRQVQTYNPSDNNQLTLSGLLNFIDGLWSSCGDEKIIVFTTNHKERLDPALLRPGRMDMHIHMSYCTPSGFKILASNFLGLKNHSMFIAIEKLIKEVEVTPAEIAEQLMKSEEVDVSLGGLVKFLQRKKIKSNELNAQREKEEKEVDVTGNERDEIKKGDEKKRGKINKRKGRMGKKQKVGF